MRLFDFDFSVGLGLGLRKHDASDLVCVCIVDELEERDVIDGDVDLF